MCMLEKLTDWLQQAGDKVMDVMLAAVIVLQLLVTISQVAMMAGVLPRGWMP